MINEESLESKLRIDYASLEDTKITVAITVTITLSVKDWKAFELSVTKSGGTISRKIAAIVAPAISKFDKAIETLKAE